MPHDDLRDPRPRPVPARRLVRVLSGVQPEQDGWLLCLHCGSWMRSLPQHIRAAHQQSGAEYREDHDLAPRTRLIAADLSAAKAQRGRERFRQVAERFHNRPARVRRLALRRSIATRRESATRAGTRSQMQTVMARRAEATRAKADQRLDHKARQAGYLDLAQLMEHNKHLRMCDIAALLGISDRYAGELYRRQFGLGTRRKKVRDPETDRAGYARRSQAVRDQTRVRWDAIAQQAGYTGMAAALSGTRDIGPAAQARLLGITKSMIYYLVRELDVPIGKARRDNMKLKGLPPTGTRPLLAGNRDALPARALT